MTATWFEKLEARGVPPPHASFGPLLSRGCPLCGGTETFPILGNQYYSLAPRDVMQVVECRGCTLMFTNPIPSPAWQRSFLDPDINTWWSRGRWMQRHWQDENEREKFVEGLEILKRLPAATRLLDVGTGPGLFVRLARDAGFDAVGSDILPQIEDADEIPFIAEPIDQLPAASYDVVTLWCVVAHEPDFLSLLRNCARLLRPGGVLLVETPNMALWRRLWRPRALLEGAGLRRGTHDALGAYGHITHFTPATLSRALRDAGFTSMRSHLVPNYREQRGLVDEAKRLLFTASARRLNLSFPLVMTACKR